jgi:hypothetical protein
MSPSPTPSEDLVAWMAEQADEDLFIVGESWKSPLERNAGSWSVGFSGPEGPQALFAGRVLPFEERASLIWARLMADGTAKGSPLDMSRRSVHRRL